MGLLIFLYVFFPALPLYMYLKLKVYINEKRISIYIKMAIGSGAYTERPICSFLSVRRCSYQSTVILLSSTFFKKQKLEEKISAIFVHFILFSCDESIFEII